MTFNYIETFIAFVDGLLLSGVGAISAALSGWMQTLMPVVLGIYVAVIGFQMIGGSLGRTPREVVSIAVRVAIVLALVRYADLYQEYVAVPVLQTIPDEIGRVLGSALGGVVRGNAFDKIAAGCLALVINVGKSLGWGQIFIAFALVPCACAPRGEQAVRPASAKVSRTIRTAGRAKVDGSDLMAVVIRAVSACPTMPDPLVSASSGSPLVPARH